MLLLQLPLQLCRALLLVRQRVGLGLFHRHSLKEQQLPLLLRGQQQRTQHRTQLCSLGMVQHRHSLQQLQQQQWGLLHQRCQQRLLQGCMQVLGAVLSSSKHQGSQGQQALELTQV